MVTSDPAEPASAGEADPRQVRVLKTVVIVLGLFLLVGFAAVIVRIAYLASQPDRGTTAARLPRSVNVTLPAGAVVRSSLATGDRLTIEFESPQKSGFLIVNLTTGDILSRIELQPEPPRQ